MSVLEAMNKLFETPALGSKDRRPCFVAPAYRATRGRYRPLSPHVRRFVSYRRFKMWGLR